MHVKQPCVHTYVHVWTHEFQWHIYMHTQTRVAAMVQEVMADNEKRRRKYGLPQCESDLITEPYTLQVSHVSFVPAVCMHAMRAL
jgi:hypothetical protein